MKITKIRLSGFKSFGVETEINLSPRVNCIVGPNGCGKSNIFDAFLWVLGQRTAHSLRGKTMDDCIFFGAKGTPRGSFAEVSLDLDVSDVSDVTATPILDQEKLTITRRHYVQAGSEYFLNNQPIRRTAMIEILRQIGFQESTYSFIGQGKITALSTADPKQHRKLIDEAARVNVPKAKKSEALGRLEETNQNLQRVQDILREKKGELEKLKAMANEAKHYYKLRDNYQQIDLQVRACAWQQLQIEKKRSSERQQEGERNNEKFRQQEKTFEEAIATLEKKLQMAQEKKQQVEVTHQSDSLLLEKQEEILWKFQKHEEQIRAKTRTLTKQLHGEEKKKKEIEQRTAENQQRRLNLSAKMEDVKRALEKKQQNKKQLEQEISTLNEQEMTMQQKTDAISKKQDEHFQRINFLNQNLTKKIADLKEFFQSQSLTLEKEKSQLLATVQEMEIELAKLQKALLVEDWSEVRRVFAQSCFQDIVRVSRQYVNCSENIIGYLFGEKGLFADSEKLKQSVAELSQEKKKMRSEAKGIHSQKKSASFSLDQLNVSVKNLEIESQTQKVQQKNTETNNVNWEKELRTIVRHIGYNKEELRIAEGELEQEKKENATYKSQLGDARLRMEKHAESLRLRENEIRGHRRALQEQQEGKEKNRKENTDALLRIERLKVEGENIATKMRDIEQELFNDYDKNFSELTGALKEGSASSTSSAAAVDASASSLSASAVASMSSAAVAQRLENLKRQLGTARRKLKETGRVNLQAENQYDLAKRNYDEMAQQKKDIEDAKENLEGFLKELEAQTVQMFQKTFSQVETHFAALVSRLFQGGKGNLQMIDPSNPLESGVEILVQPSGKKNTSISVLSGGEQSLTALAFLFAMYLIYPSPFCFFDEIDANLDDANIPLVLNLIKEHSEKTQFVIVTHSRLTIARGDLIVGVTQEIPGLSHVVGLEPAKYKKAG